MTSHQYPYVYRLNWVKKYFSSKQNDGIEEDRLPEGDQL